MIDATGEENEAQGSECPANGPRKTKGIMTDAEVYANAINFLGAGNETTTTTLCFASYLLALHPAVQEKLQSEIDDYFKEKPVSRKFYATTADHKSREYKVISWVSDYCPGN